MPVQDGQKFVQEALDKANVNKKCPLCKGSFSAIEGHGTLNLDKEGVGTSMVDPEVVYASCDRCGFTSSHIARQLGLILPSV